MDATPYEEKPPLPVSYTHLEAKQIVFRYPRRGQAAVLNGVSLTLTPGERVGLAAPSGRGKTTLCKLLAGYERPVSGEILLDGRPLAQYTGACPCLLYTSRVVILFMEEDAAFLAAQAGQVDVAYTSATYSDQTIGGYTRLSTLS